MKIAKKKSVSNGNEFKKCMQRGNDAHHISTTQRYIGLKSDQLSQAVELVRWVRAAQTRRAIKSQQTAVQSPFSSSHTLVVHTEMLLAEQRQATAIDLLGLLTLPLKGIDKRTNVSICPMPSP